MSTAADQLIDPAHLSGLLEQFTPAEREQASKQFVASLSEAHSELEQLQRSIQVDERTLRRRFTR